MTKLKPGMLVEITDPESWSIPSSCRGAWGVLALRLPDPATSGAYQGLFYCGDNWQKWWVKESTVRIIGQLDWSFVNEHDIEAKWGTTSARTLASGHIPASLYDAIMRRTTKPLGRAVTLTDDEFAEKLVKVNQALHDGTLPPQEGIDMFSYLTQESIDGYIGQIKAEGVIVYQTDPISADSVADEAKDRGRSADSLAQEKALDAAKEAGKNVVKGWFAKAGRK